MVVIRQNCHQIINKENSIIISENKPPHFRRFTIDYLLHDSRHSDGRSEPAWEGVGEPGSIRGYDHRREGGSGDVRRAIEEDEGACGLGVVPEADVGLAVGEGFRGGGDGEQKVANGGGGGGGGGDGCCGSWRW